MYIFQFVDAHLSKRILHEARRQQQEIEDDTGISPSTSKKKVTKLGDASDDDSCDEAELQDDMDGDYYENIVRIEYTLFGEITFAVYPFFCYLYLFSDN
jgi:hypothetical protein